MKIVSSEIPRAAIPVIGLVWNFFIGYVSWFFIIPALVAHIVLIFILVIPYSGNLYIHYFFEMFVVWFLGSTSNVITKENYHEFGSGAKLALIYMIISLAGLLFSKLYGFIFKAAFKKYLRVYLIIMATAFVSAYFVGLFSGVIFELVIFLIPVILMFVAYVADVVADAFRYNHGTGKLNKVEVLTQEEYDRGLAKWKKDMKKKWWSGF